MTLFSQNELKKILRNFQQKLQRTHARIGTNQTVLTNKCLNALIKSCNAIKSQRLPLNLYVKYF